MRAFIDTNLFVYASSQGFPQHQQAQQFLSATLQSNDLWYISWNVVYEYLRVVTHPRIFPEGPMPFASALENISNYIQAPNIEVLQESTEHPLFLKNLEVENPAFGGNILHDAHSVLLMREHDLNLIYTADTDFHRFKGIKVVNPLLA